VEIWEELARLERQGRQAALVTVIRTQGSTPREVGARMIVFPDGSIKGTVGGSAVEALVIGEAREVMQQAKPRLVQHDLTDWTSDTGMICGGKMEFLIEPLATRPQLYIFGGGHVGLALARLAEQLEYPCHVLEDRPDFATPERFPQAASLRVGAYSEMARDLEPVQPAYYIILTRCHDTDLEVLRETLRKPGAYLGVICSRPKKAEMFRLLTEEGARPEELERVHAPIGLDIGSQSPPEIAVSIIAEIIREFKAHTRR